MNTLAIFLCGFTALFAAAFVEGGPQEATFKSDVKVVSVIASVRDKNGRLVRDLEKVDFTVFEEGKPQTIQYFSRETDLPLTLGLMIDTSMSQVKVMDAERSASGRFIDQILREEKDRVFVMQFDMTVRLKQPLTSSRKALSETLPFVDTPTRNELMHQTGGGTLLYDAVEKAAKEIMISQTGRKALIVMSDGEDTGSETTLSNAIEAAQRADTMIYSVLFSDSGAYSRGGRGTLERMSRETGGGFYEITKKQPLEAAFSQLEEELRSQYSLGFVSPVPVEISEFRKLQVKLGRSGLKAQARERYWAKR